MNHKSPQQVGTGNADRQANDGDHGECFIAPPTPEDEFKGNVSHDNSSLFSKLMSIRRPANNNSIRFIPQNTKRLIFRHSQEDRDTINKDTTQLLTVEAR